MKKCFKCGIAKELNLFYKHKQMGDGHLNKCIECTKKDTANNDKVFSNRTNESYDKTEKGVIRVMYKTQVRNSKVRKMDLPNYTKQEFKEWLYDNNFKKIYDKWVLSGYKKEFKPSADRNDDFKPYSLDNITLTTWQDNINHNALDILTANNKSGQRCKSVIQLDKNGNILAEYYSLSYARRIVGYSMGRSIKIGSPSRKDGTFWRYKND